MAKYKVVEEVEVFGEVRAAGSEIEIDEETARQFVSEGTLELVPETPPTPPASGEATPPPPVATPSTATEEKPKSWVGGHSI